MFAFPVKNVKKTKILVAPLDTAGLEQLTIYENSVSRDPAGKPIVMVLPVPNPTKRADFAKFYSMTDCNDFFKTLDSRFHRMLQHKSASRGVPDGALFGSLSPLEIVTSGSYSISLAPTISDLDRLQTDFFGELPASFLDFVQKHYPSTFGFIVCQSSKTNEDFEPIAYSHATASKGQLFVPTRHEHGGDGAEEKADWHHKIYVIGSTGGNFAFGLYSDVRFGVVKLDVGKFEEGVTPDTLLDPLRIWSDRSNATFDYHPSSSFKNFFERHKIKLLPTLPKNIIKYEIQGNYKNEDLFFTCPTEPAPSPVAETKKRKREAKPSQRPPMSEKKLKRIESLLTNRSERPETRRSRSQREENVKRGLF